GARPRARCGDQPSHVAATRGTRSRARRWRRGCTPAHGGMLDGFRRRCAPTEGYEAATARPDTVSMRARRTMRGGARPRGAPRPREEPAEPLNADLSAREIEESERRSAPRAVVVHEAISREGEDELRRPTSALA